MYNHLPNDKPISGIEIGVWEGGNAKRMMDKLPNLKLIGIDPFEAYQDWCGYLDERIISDREKIAIRDMQPYVDAERFSFLREYSDKALEFIEDESMDFVYIDGDHSYKWALHDITNYWGKVKHGGVLCGHDRSLEGVKKALDEFGVSYIETNDPQPDSWYILKQ